MIPHDEFVSRLRREFDDAVEKLSEPLVQGRAESFDDYARWTGRIAGLGDARQLLDDLVKRLNEGVYE